VAAYGGRAELMDHVAPLGPVYQAGTLAGNPLAMRAGIAALKQLTKPGSYDEMTQLARRLVFGLRAELADAGIPAQINAIGSLSTVFFTTGAGKKLRGCQALRPPSDTPNFSAKCSIGAYFWRRHSSRLLLFLRPTPLRILTVPWRRRTNRCRSFLLILRSDSRRRRVEG